MNCSSPVRILLGTTLYLSAIFGEGVKLSIDLGKESNLAGHGGRLHARDAEAEGRSRCSLGDCTCGSQGRQAKEPGVIGCICNHGMALSGCNTGFKEGACGHFLFMRNKIMVGDLALLVLLMALYGFLLFPTREHIKNPDFSGDVGQMNPDFQQMLDTYTQQYSAYRVNGTAGSLAAYQRIQTQIEAALNAMRDRVQQDREYVQSFLSQYQGQNQSIVSLHEASQKLQGVYPELKDQEVVAKQQSTLVDTSVSWTSIVFKVGCVIALLLLVILLRPSLTVA